MLGSLIGAIVIQQTLNDGFNNEPISITSLDGMNNIKNITLTESTTIIIVRSIEFFASIYKKIEMQSWDHMRFRHFIVTLDDVLSQNEMFVQIGNGVNPLNAHSLVNFMSFLINIVEEESLFCLFRSVI